MISTDFAQTFAKKWIESWNSHKLDQILSHYSEDFIIETPMAAQLLPKCNGIVKGKEAVKIYWTIGLELIPNLNFEIIDVLSGINGLTIYYINTATKRKSVELFSFNGEGKVDKSIVYYST